MRIQVELVIIVELELEKGKVSRRKGFEVWYEVI